MQQPIVSLFDESGLMLRPWAERGFTCYAFDIQNDGRVEEFASGGSISYVKADLMPDDWRVEGATNPTIESIIAMNPAICFGFGPCDDLAVCGAKHFAGKLAADPDCQLRAVALWRVVETVGNRVGCPWFGENPRSRLSTLYRRYNFRFDPSDFGGYLPIEDVHPMYPDIIPPRDAYTKDTWIWTGNGFAIPPRRPIGDCGYYPGWAHLGGKSARTKRIRSSTPRGWAAAVFFANWTLKQFTLAA
jgi:hypothetical protein